MDVKPFSRAFAARFQNALHDGGIQAAEFRRHPAVGARNNHARMIRLINDSITEMGEDYLNEYRIAEHSAPTQYGGQAMFRADAVSLPNLHSETFTGVFQYRSLDAGRKVTIHETRQLLRVQYCPTRLIAFPITSTEAGVRSGRYNGKEWLLDDVKSVVAKASPSRFAGGPLGVLTIEDASSVESARTASFQLRLHVYEGPERAEVHVV